MYRFRQFLNVFAGIAQVRSTRPSGSGIGTRKARDHDITKVAPAFWAIPVLEKTPSAASIDGSAERFCRRLFLMLRSVNRGLHVRDPFRFRHCQPGRKNQILWLRSAEILQWGKEKIHVGFAYHCGRAAGAKRSRVRRADVGGVTCSCSTYRS